MARQAWMAGGYVIQRGDYYLMAERYGWTLWRHRAALFPTAPLAQILLDEFPEEFREAVVYPVQGGGDFWSRP